MKVIAKPRGTGKTHDLFIEAALNHGQVLCVNKRAIRSKADAYGMYDIPVIDWNDLMYGNYDEKRPLYIDNAEYVFSELFKNDFELELQGINVNVGD